MSSGGAFGGIRISSLKSATSETGSANGVSDWGVTDWTNVLDESQAVNVSKA